MRKVIVVGLLLALAGFTVAHLSLQPEPVTHEGSPAFQALLDQAIARLDGVAREITVTTVGEAHANGQGLMQTVAGEITCDGVPTCDGSPGCYTMDPSDPACSGQTYDPGDPACITMDPTNPDCLEPTTDAACVTMDPVNPDCQMETVYPALTCDRDNTACWDLTYDPASPTCQATAPTCDANETCSRFYTCDSQYTCHGEQTCDGSATCWSSTCDEPDMTCDGSPTCDPAVCIPYTFQGNYTCDSSPTCHETCEGWPGCGLATVYGSDTCDRDRPDCWDLTYDPAMPTCEAGLVTCDATETCSRFYTCDSQYTCHGEETCNGTFTCWSSTCADAQTCDGTAQCCNPAYTFQGNYTCDDSPTCHTTCGAEGWPTCSAVGLPTCDGNETCHNTCDGWLGCVNGQPSGSDRTTWGGMKKQFSE
jgi:hypothetical protein